MATRIIKKCYYIANENIDDSTIAVLNTPTYCVGCAVELIEMNYSQITVECYDWQVERVENLLASMV